MGHYDSPTPKRHYGYANSREILKLDRGRLQMSQRKPRKDRVKTAVVYKDRSGKQRYKGTKLLRATENLIVIDGHPFFLASNGICCWEVCRNIVVMPMVVQNSFK